MRRRVLGAVDLICLHQDLRVQKDPITGTLLEEEMFIWIITDNQPDRLMLPILFELLNILNKHKFTRLERLFAFEMFGSQ